MFVSLSIIWDKYGEISHTLKKGTEKEINDFVFANYENSEQIRNSEEFKEEINKFLKGKPIPEVRKNHRGSIVILKYNDDLSIEKLKVMYKKDVYDSIKFVKQLYNKMLEERNYTRKILKLYPQLFLEQEKISLYTDLKYNYKTYYKINLRNWKKKFVDSEMYIHNLRKIYKCFDEEIETLKKVNPKNSPIKKQETYSNNEYQKEEFLTEKEIDFMNNYDAVEEEKPYIYKKKITKKDYGQISFFDKE